MPYLFAVFSAFNVRVSNFPKQVATHPADIAHPPHLLPVLGFDEVFNLALMRLTPGNHVLGRAIVAGATLALAHL